MFRRFILAALLLSAKPTFAADISTILGSPDMKLDFVQELLQSRSDLISENSEARISTAVYSILARRDVQSVHNVNILNSSGSTSFELLTRAINDASAHARVVLSVLGGDDQVTNRICETMATYKNNIFVMVAGSSASFLDSERYSHCVAENIIIVGSLDAKKTGLADQSNYGNDVVKIVAPSINIRVILPGDESSRLSSNTMASSFVAAHIASFWRSHQQLSTTQLLQHFYEKQAVMDPSIADKVQMGRKLIDTGF